MLSAAEKLSASRGLRMTPPRLRVLRIVAASTKPVKAYDILRKMGRGAKPPTVYRALDFLTAAGLIHKIQNGAAFVACSHPRLAHACCLLICANCGKCGESCARRPDVALRRAAAAAGFLARDLTMEISGLCKTCRKQQTA